MLKPIIISIEKDISGCHFVSVAYPENKVYEYKINCSNDIETIKFFRDKGFTNKWIRLLKMKGEIWKS